MDITSLSLSISKEGGDQVLVGVSFGIAIFAGTFFLLTLIGHLIGHMCKKKKLTISALIGIIINVFKSYIFLIIQLAVLFFFFRFPRRCSEVVLNDQYRLSVSELSSTCEEKKNFMEKEILDLANKISNHLDSLPNDINITCNVTENIFDTCEVLPPEEEAICRKGSGFDEYCGCTKAKVYPQRSGWVDFIPQANYCESYNFDAMFMESFNRISNEGLSIGGIFINFNTTGDKDEQNLLMYPLRKLSNHSLEVEDGGYELNGYDVYCQEIEDECRATEDIALGRDTDKLFKKRKDFDTVIYVDYSFRNGNDFDGTIFHGSDDLNRQSQLFSFFMDEEYNVQDKVLICGFAKGYNYTSRAERGEKEFIFFTDEHYEDISDWMDEEFGKGEKKNVGNITDIFQDGTNRWEAQKESRYDDFIQILFIRNEFEGTLDPFLNRTLLAFIFVYNSSYTHPQEQEICDAALASGGNCSVFYTYLDDEDDREDEKDRFKEFFSAEMKRYGSKATNREIIFSIPHFRGGLNYGEVVTNAIKIPTDRYGLAYLVIDYHKKMIIDEFCNATNDMDFAYEDIVEAIINGNENFLFALQLSAITICFAAYLLLHVCGETIAMLLNGSKIKVIKAIGLFVAHLNELHNIWLVFVFMINTTIVLLSMQYAQNLAVYFIITFVYYLILVFLGVCCLQLRSYQIVKDKPKSVPRQDKELKSYRNGELKSFSGYEEEDEDVKKLKKIIKTKGLGLIIDHIEFDSYVKGRFTNVELKSGDLIAILGHSGAGKSTFFNSLLGQHSPKSFKAKIQYKNTETNERMQTEVSELDELKPYVGFVPQKDIVPENVTVYEQLLVQVKQKFNTHSADIINYFCKALHMDGEILNKFPRQLSGGQLKRLSILNELVLLNPIILFDEPTSGLDGVSALDLIDNMKKLTKLGFCCVVIAHSPSTEILSMFDKLYLFLKNENQVRCAQVDLQLKSNINADILDKYLRFPDNFIKTFEIKEAIKDANKPKVDDYKLFAEIVKKEGNVFDSTLSFFVKWFWLITRTSVQQLRDTVSTLTDILMICVTNFGLAILFNPQHAFEGTLEEAFKICLEQACQDITNPGDSQRDELIETCSKSDVEYRCSLPENNPVEMSVFMLIVSIGLLSLITSLRIFGGEKAIMTRQFRGGVNFVQYYFSKLFGVLPRILLSILLLVSFFYTTFCFQTPFWLVFLNCFGLWIWVTGVGIICTLIFKGKENAMESAIVGAIFVIICDAFAGTFVTNRITDSIQKENFLFLEDRDFVINILRVIQYFSYAYFGNYALYAVEVYQYHEAYPTTVQQILDEYAYDLSPTSIVTHIIIFAIELIVIYGFGLLLLFNYHPDKLRFFRNVKNFILTFTPRKLKTFISEDFTSKSQSESTSESFANRNKILWLEYKEENDPTVNPKAVIRKPGSASADQETPKVETETETKTEEDENQPQEDSFFGDLSKNLGWDA